MKSVRASLPWLALVLGIVAMTGLTWLGGPARARTALPDRAEVFRVTLARFDTDRDGRISLEEWTRHGGDREMFGVYDFNADGRLDVTELEAFLVTVAPRPAR